jgi:hypothetical protein
MTEPDQEDDPPETVPPPPRKSRRSAKLIIVGLAVVVLGGALLLYVGWQARGPNSASPGVPAPPSTTTGPPATKPPLAAGCLSYDSRYEIEPGKVTEVTARVDFGQCVQQAQDAKDYELVSNAQNNLDATCATMTPAECEAHYQEVLAWYNAERDKIYQETQKAIVGGKAHVELTAPLFDGKIEGLSNADQMVREAGDVGRWSWQVRPDKPGDQQLALVMTILDPDSNEVLFRNRPETIYVHTPTTAGYVAGSVWSGITSFGAAITGLVVAVVGALAAIIGIVPKLRRKKKAAEDASDQPKPGGYM